MRRAIKLTEASSPCVLWIDESEKAFAGVKREGSNSEVTMRLFGTFLTRMQEKESPSFVVAAANRIDDLPPELLRNGRFNETFYVALPDDDERKKISEIHIRKRRKSDLASNELKRLVSETKGYCGANFEGIVRESIETAFIKKKPALSTADIPGVIRGDGAERVATFAGHSRHRQQILREHAQYRAGGQQGRVASRDNREQQLDGATEKLISHAGEHGARDRQ